METFTILITDMENVSFLPSQILFCRYEKYNIIVFLYLHDAQCLTLGDFFGEK